MFQWLFICTPETGLLTETRLRLCNNVTADYMQFGFLIKETRLLYKMFKNSITCKTFEKSDFLSAETQWLNNRKFHFSRP